MSETGRERDDRMIGTKVKQANHGQSSLAPVFVYSLLAVALVMIVFMAMGEAAASVDVTAVDVTPAYRDVEAGETGSYSVQIDLDHTGANADVYANLTNGTGGWIAWIDGAGQSRSWMNVSTDMTYWFTVYVTVPLTATPDDPPFQANLYVNTTDGTGQQVSWETNVAQTYAIWLEPTNGTERSADRGDTVGFQFSLHNDGNAPDTILLAYGYSTSDIVVTAPMNLTVNGSTNDTLTVWVEISAWAEARTRPLIVQATSEDNATVDVAYLNVTVNPDHTYSLMADDPTLEAGPLENAPFNLRLTNSGNEDVNFTFIVLEDITPWTYIVSPTWAVVGWNDTQNVSVSIRPDANATFGTTLNVTVVAIPEAGHGTNRSTIVSVLVTRDVSARLTGASSAGTVAPGSSVNATVTVHNDGNGQDTFTIDASGPTDWTFQFLPSTPIIDPFDNVNVTVVISAPVDAPYGQVNVRVNATSSADTSVTTTDLVISVDVSEIESIQLTMNDTIDRSVSVDGQNGQATFNFTAENNGNRQRTVNISALDTNSTGWGSGTFTPLTLTLDPDEVADMSFILTVPEYNDAGIFHYSILGEIGTANSTLTFTITVLEYQSVTLTAASVNASRSEPVPDGEIVIEATVHNDGNLDIDVEFGMNLPTGWTMLNATPSWTNVARDASANVIIYVALPTYVNESENYYPDVKVSTYPGSSTLDTRAVEVTIEEVIGVQLNIDGLTTRSTDPAEDAVFDLVITNEGNSLRVMTLSVTNELTGWSYQFSQRTPSVSPFSTYDVTLTVTPSSTALNGTYMLALDVRTGGINDTKTCNVIVNPLYLMELTAPVVLGSGRPTDTVSFDIGIENMGNADDIVHVSLGDTSLPVTTVMNVTNTTHSLVARASGGSIIDVYLPGTSDVAPGWYYLIVEGRAENGTPLDTGDDILDEVNLTIVVEEVFMIVLTTGDSQEFTEPGGTVTYTMMIHNTGTGDSYFYVNATGQRASWATHSPQYVLILAGENVTVDITITLPSWSQLPQSVKDDMYVIITFNVTCEEDYSVNDGILFNTTVLTRYAITASSPSGQEGGPGDMLSFNLSIMNSGTHQDTFSTTITNVPTGWSASFVDPGDAIVALSPSANEVIGVNVTISSDHAQANAGAFTVQLEFLSVGANRTLTTRSLPVTVRQIHGVTLVCPTNPLSARPNNGLDYVVTVYNTGNDNDTIDLALTGAYTSWGQIRSGPDRTGVEVTDVNLGPGNSTVVYVNLNASSGTVPGNYTIGIEASHADGNTTLPLWLLIESDPDVTVTSSPSTLYGAPGDSVTFTVRLRNTGTSVDSYILNMSGVVSTWPWVEFYDLPVDDPNRTVISMAENVTKGVTVDVFLTVPIPLLTEGNATRIGEYTVNVMGWSLEDESVMDNFTLTVNVQPIYMFSIFDPNPFRTVDWGGTAIFSFDVTNVGNLKDTYRIETTMVPDPDWETEHQTFLTVGRIKTGSLQINVTCPTDAESGNYSVEITITSTEDGSVAMTHELVVGVNVTYGISIETTTKTREGKFGNDVTFLLTVENEGNSPSLAHLSVVSGILDSNTTFSFGNMTGAQELDVTLEGPTSSHSVSVVVHIPDRATIEDLLGNDTVPETNITVEAYPTGAPAAAVQMVLTVTFAPVYDFALEDGIVNRTVDPTNDEYVHFTVRVRNTGTRTDSYVVDVIEEPGNLLITTDYDGASIDPYSYLDITVNASLPEDDDDIVSGLHEIVLRVSADENPTVQHEIGLGLEVEPFFYSFSLQDIDVTKNFDPLTSDDLQFSLRIVNDGVRSDSYIVDIINNPFPGDLDISTDYTGTVLDPGENAIVLVNVTQQGPDPDIHSGQYTLGFRVVSDGNLSLHTTNDLDLQVLQFHEITITASPAYREISPGTPVNYTIRIVNGGNGNETCSLSIISMNPTTAFGSLSAPSQNITGDHDLNGILVPRGSEVQTLLEIDMTREEAVQWFPATVENRLNATLHALTSGGTDSNDIVVRADIVDIYDFDLDTGTHDQRNITQPANGANVTFDLFVFNTGTSADTYTITTTSDENLPVTITYDDGGDAISGSMNVSMQVTMEVMSASELPAGTYPINLTVRSTALPVLVATHQYHVTVDMFGVVYLERLDLDGSIRLNRTRTYRFILRNDGNVPDTIDLALSTGPGEPFGILVAGFGTPNETEVSSAQVTLGRGVSTIFGYRVTADKDRLIDSDITEIVEDVIATSTTDPIEQESLTFTTDLVAFERIINVKLSSSIEISPVAGENSVIVTLIVTNMGEDIESIEVSIEPALAGGNDTEGNMTWVMMKHGDSTGSSFTIPAVRTGSTNSESFKIVFELLEDPSLYPPGVFGFNLTARIPNVDTIKYPESSKISLIKVTIPEVQGITLDVTPDSVDMDPRGIVADANVDVTLTLTNNGNLAETVSISLDGVVEELSITLAGGPIFSRALEPGESISTVVSVTNEGVPLPGPYPFKILVDPNSTEDFEITVPVTVLMPRIRFTSDDITLVPGQSKIRKGDTTLITMRMTNTGSTTSTALTLTVMTDGTQLAALPVAPIPVGEYHETSVNWTWPGYGTHEIEITLTGTYPVEINVTKNVAYVDPSDTATGDGGGGDFAVGLIAGIVIGIIAGAVGLILFRRFRPPEGDDTWS